MTASAGDDVLRQREGSMPDFECPSCGGAGQVPNATGASPLVRCGDCGLMFRKPNDIAPTLHANIVAFERMARGRWESFYDGWNARERGKILDHLRSPGKALEIGPGRGAFIAYLRKEGYRVEGVDISGDICADLEDRFGVRMVHGTLEEFQGDGSYDLIAAHHVVEHVQDIRSFLGKCRSLLAPGGGLLVSCPNVASWAAAFRSWPGYEPYHCLFFTPESLVKALGKCGYTVSGVRLRQPFTGWWNVLFRSLAGTRGAGARPNVASKDRSRPVRFLYNGVRFVGSALLLPLTIVADRLSRGEEIVILAVKADAYARAPVAADMAERVGPGP